MIKNRNYSLDLLRVIACYLVIQQHASDISVPLKWDELNN